MLGPGHPGQTARGGARRTLTGTCIQEEPKHRKDLERSADFRSDLVRKAASERGGAV